MSKPKRLSLADRLGQEDASPSSRDHVITSSREPAVAAQLETPVAAEPTSSAEPEAKVIRARSPKVSAKEPPELRRHSYHASLYLPVEAQFALREIALTMRRAKPHDVMLEAMAELFEKYNKGKLAKECRARIGRKHEIT